MSAVKVPWHFAMLPLLTQRLWDSAMSISSMEMRQGGVSASIRL